MTVHGVLEFIKKDAPSKLLACPICKSRKLNVEMIQRAGNPYIVAIRCESSTCKKRVVYDVTNGFITE